MFAKNRDRLIEHEAVETFFAEVMALAELADKRGRLSREHFSVDGTLVRVWANPKSVRPKDDRGGGQRPPGRNAVSDWRGRPRSHDTPASTTDPDARLFRKSPNTAAILCDQGHALIVNRYGLVVGAVVTRAGGGAEREAAWAMMRTMPRTRHRTLAADKAYDTAAVVPSCRLARVTPHVARNEMRRGGRAIDARPSRHPGYEVSRRIRKRIDEHVGWAKTVGRRRRNVFRGPHRVDLPFKLTMLASNIVRMSRMPAVVSCNVSTGYCGGSFGPDLRDWKLPTSQFPRDRPNEPP